MTADEPMNEGFLDSDELPVPTDVPLTDGRLATIVRRLAGADSAVLSPVQAEGPLAGGGGPRRVDVGSQTFEVPSTAKVNGKVRDGRPGVLIESADPIPAGTALWIAGEAARHVNGLLRDL